MANKVWEYFLNDNYSFSVTVDSAGRKTGKLIDLNSNEVLADNLMQKVIPENLPNLLNVAKVVISAAWQDGKILPEEKEAFNNAFKNVAFTDEQRTEIEKEFKSPTPIGELIKDITSRDEQMLILETSILLVIADGEFHPKEKDFIDYLVKEFGLNVEDFALLYRILPERAKKYFIKEKLHEGLNIKADEIEILDKFVPKIKVEELKHENVYMNLMSNWRNRRTRYSRVKSY
ncbi:MAG: TerB family tellurite resistance protein [Candidatus Cloacimonetes bacterium]|nr:TerB family tellurite resistance protein [Candidatus Cloacimonadota bacterium]